MVVLTAGCNRHDRERITLTGCLQPGEQGLAAREPNAAARSSEGVRRFVLANAMSPASPLASSTDSSPLYILEGNSAELRRHVGQQVEITGGPPETSSDASGGHTRRIRVASIRRLAPNCR